MLCYRLARLALAVAGLLLCAPAAAVQVAGSPDTDEDDSPRVERITFRGAESLLRGDLADRIETEATRCRVWILRPLCAITDWRLIHVRRYLDREELVTDETRLRVYYFQRGFRSASVESRLQRRGRGVEVIFDIEEGPPTIVESTEVTQAGRAVTARQIRRADLPQPGERLDLVRLSDGIVRLTDRLGSGGWLDGAVHDTVDVAPDALRGSIRVAIEPGRRSTLGRLQVIGNEHVTEGVISDGLRLRHGRPLRVQDLVASQRSLYESNLFHEARVRVPAQPDSAKVVEITVREAAPQAARVGGGFNTLEFVQLEARYTHYNFLGGGRRVEVRGTVGNLLAGQLNGVRVFRDVVLDNAGGLDPQAFKRPTWLASLDFIQPSFRSAMNSIGMSVFSHRRIVPGIVIDQGLGAELSFTRRLDYRTPVSGAYRFEFTGIEAGELYFCVNYGVCDLPTVEVLQQRQRLSPVQASFVSNHANDPIAPTSGYRVRVNAEHASRSTLSAFAHNRISAEAALYHPLDVHRRRVLAGRLRLGFVQPLSGTARGGIEDPDAELGNILHPRKRFYAGGSRSVRGFGENQLGPRVLTVSPEALLTETGGCTRAELLDGSCDPNTLPVGEFTPRPVGGRNVIEASVEYRFPVLEIQAAVFLDAARVGAAGGGVPGGAVMALTPGAGVRFESPVGPVRIDVGVRPGLRQDLRVITEAVDEDGVARLVPLQTARTYDPVGDARGFLRQVFGRMMLHLSIGEAF